jgi:carbamoyl-phosphate synthase large subunit
MNNSYTCSTILITGYGGDIGLAVGKIIKSSNLAKKIIGCDILDDCAGKSLLNLYQKIERADSMNYIESLRKLIETNNVDIIIPTSENEIRFLHKHKINNINGIPILKSNYETLETCLDKYKTFKFLETNNIDRPWTVEVKKGNPKQLPCLIKDKNGHGSKNVFLVTDKNSLEYYKNLEGDNVWQELLEPSDQEYTCGLYRSKKEEIRTIIFKRKLQGGYTKFAETVSNDRINNMIHLVAKKLNLFGSINIQLILTSRGPVIFEINPRFSSTVSFRNKVGFEDVKWSLEEFFGKDISAYNPQKIGTKIFRVFKEEVIN